MLKMGHWGGINKSSILLTDGGELVMGSSGFADNTIVVDGTGIFSVGQTTAIGDDNAVLDVNSSFSGNGTLTITGYTQYATRGYTLNMNRVISDGADGGKLSLYTGAHALKLSQANTYSGGTTIAGGTVTSSNLSALGTGAVTMAGGTLAMESALTIGSLSGESGVISTGENALNINQKENGSYAGSLSGSAAITKAGAASLALTASGLTAGSLVVEDGSLTISDITLSTALTMTVANGDSLSIDNLTMGADASLIYTTANLAAVGNFSAQGALSLNLDGIVGILLQQDGSGYKSYDLGLDLSGVTTTVKGLEESSYTISHVSGGHSFITLAENNAWAQDFTNVSWEAAWGLHESVSLAKTIVPEANLTLQGGSYDEGGAIVLSITGTQGAESMNIIGATTVTTGGDHWLEVKGGTLATVVLGGQNVDFEGNTHVQATGGSMEMLIGGNASEGPRNTTFTGNSYLSLSGEAQVHGLIVGGSWQESAETETVFNGNSHLIIRNLQPADGAALTNYLGSDFVVGGNAVTDLNKGTVIFNGSTQVDILLDSSISTGSFSRNIVGGNLSMGGSVDDTLRVAASQSLADDTSVRISAAYGVSFDQVVAVGHYAGNALGSYSITGQSSVSIEGGHFTNVVTVGTFINNSSGSKSVDVGSARLDISGGVFDGSVSGAATLKSGSNHQTTVTTGDVAVMVSGGEFNSTLTGGLHVGSDNVLVEMGTLSLNLTGGTLNSSITGGVYAPTASTRTLNGTIEAVTLTLDGATVNGNIYGGAYVARLSGGSTLSVGSVDISVLSGTLNGNIYAGGVQQDDNELELGSTSITLSTAATYSDGIVVSGGFETERGTVTGSRSLVLLGASDRALAGVSVQDVDSITNAGNVALASMSSDATVRKDGAGTLTLGSLGSGLSLDIAQGAVELQSVQNLGAVSGAGALRVNTQGVVQASELLQQTTAHTGRLSVESGELAVSGAVATQAQGVHLDGASLSMAEGANLSGTVMLEQTTTVTADAAAEIAADIRSEGLTKQGIGALTLSGNNSMAGLVVQQGTLVAASSSALGAGDVSVAAGAELALDAAVSGVDSLALADGASLPLNAALAWQTVLCGDGARSLGAVLTLSFTGELTQGDTFTLLAGSLSQADSAWNVVSDTRLSISTAATGNSLTFTVDAVGAASLVWQGDAAATWDAAANNKVWVNGSSSDSFYRNDHVSFGASEHKAVAVVENGVQASSIRILEDGYSFSGGSISTGSIFVAEGATAEMSSLLNSEGDLSYSGHGTLRLMGGQEIAGTLQLEQGMVELSSTSGLVGGVQIAEGATLSLYTAGTVWDSGSLRGSGTVRLEGGNYTASALAGAFALTESGVTFSGTLAVGNGSDFSIDAASSTANVAETTFLLEQGGSLSMDAQRTLRSAVELAGGSLRFNSSGTHSGAISVSAASGLQVAAESVASLNGSLNGDGVLTKSGEGVLDIGGLEGSGLLSVAEGVLSVSEAASLGSLSMAQGTTLDLTQGQLLTVGRVDFDRVTLELGTLAVGHYELMEITGGADATALSQLTLSTDSRLVYDLSMVNNKLTLDIMGTAAGALAWQGTEADHVWDTSVSHKPWNVTLAESGDSVSTRFLSHDAVTFGAADLRDVVVAEGGVQAAAVQVNEGGYSFTGGSISAASLTDAAASGTNAIANNMVVSGALTKLGAGTLELSGSNSLGSVVLQAGKLVAASDGALGSATVSISGDASLYVANNAQVTNTLTGGKYTVGADAGEVGSFSGNAAASLLSSGFSKDGEGEVTVVNSHGQNPAGSMTINAGTLSYDAGNSNQLGAVSGDGTFVLTQGAVNANNIDVGLLRVENSILAYNSTFDGKALEVSGQGAELRMGHWASVNNSQLLLEDGGQLSMSSSGFSGSTVTVDGAGIIAVGETASKDDNLLLNINSTVTGNGTLSVTNYGALTYTVNVNKAVVDGASGSLAVSTNQGDLHFCEANTYSGGTTITGGKLTTHDAAALGSGSVVLTGGTLALASGLSINNLSGSAGTVDMGANALHITQTEAGSYAGGLSGTGTLTKDGAAALSLTGTGLAAGTLVVEQGVLNVADITLSGALDMNLAEGATLNISNLTMEEGSSLVYTGMSNYASIGNVSGSLILNLDAVMDQLTEAGSYDLGLNLSNVAATVQGDESDLYSIELDSTTGHSVIRLVDGVYSTVAWDENWGVADTAGKVWHAELSETMGLSGTKYDNGTRTAISVSGTEGVVNLYATTADGSAASGDAWVEITGGEFGVIAGSNAASSSGNISGDVHIMMNGGEADRVIGFADKSANNPVHEGNSYISIGKDAIINDSVIGAGTSERGGTATLKGNTNVYVYRVLSENGELNTQLGYNGDERDRRYNAIIGGFARVTDWGTTWRIEGSTNVKVDVADYAGAEASFVKAIYGGNVSDTYSHIGTITGDTNVSIAANDMVTFTENIVAGSLKGGDEMNRADIIEGNTTLTINGGIYAGDGKVLTGGSWVTGGTSKIEGTASVVLGGDAVINRDVYAAGIANGGSSTVGATQVDIGKDVSVGAVTLSGGFGGSATASVTGERNLNVAGGVERAPATVKDCDKASIAEGTVNADSGKFLSGSDFEKAGAGTLSLGGTGAISGKVTLSEGTLALNGQTVSGSMSFAGDADKTVTGSLSLGTPADNSFTYSGTGAAVVDATIANSSNRLVFNVGSAGKGEAFAEVTVNGTIGTTGTSFGIDKNGEGTLKLTGTNAFAWGFNVKAGRVIAASDSALGAGSIDVDAGATVEIAKGTHALIHHHLNMASGSELIVHELSTEKAAFATDGSSMGWWEHSSLGALTLTLEKDIELDAVTGYKVISLESGGTLAEGVTADDMAVNYKGNGRYDFTTRFESSTLYLDATRQANTDLVWDGSQDEDSWNQLAQNKNWNRLDDGTTNSSFMNQDTVQFTDAAASKKVAVAEEGVQVKSLSVNAEGYSFSGGAVKAESALVNETVALEKGASLNLGEVYTVSQKNGAAAASVGPVVMSSDLSAMKGVIQGQAEDGQAVLDNVVIDIAKGASLELNDVLLTENSRVTDDPATVSLNNVTVELGAANTYFDGATTLGSPTALVATGSDTPFNLAADTQVVSVFCSALDTVMVTGASLTLDLSGIANSLATDWKDSQYVAISFGQTKDSLAHFDATKLSISATYDGLSANTVYVKMDEQSSTTTLYVANTAANAVPEPTTATLSLLALTLLAARRRRRA